MPNDEMLKRVGEVLRRGLPDLHVFVEPIAYGTDRVYLKVMVKPLET